MAVKIDAVIKGARGIWEEEKNSSADSSKGASAESQQPLKAPEVTDPPAGPRKPDPRKKRIAHTKSC